MSQNGENANDPSENKNSSLMKEMELRSYDRILADVPFGNF
jgi:hypothetical protein